MSNQEILAQGMKELGIQYECSQLELLLQYHQLLQKWNRVYNLTSVRDPIDMLSLHLLDSLTVLPYLEGNNCLDVGTGPGLPGIPLAIMSPQRQFVLLDSNSKKTRFIQQAIIEMGLKNVTVVSERVEKFQPESKFDIIVSRAFALVSEMLSGAAHLIKENGYFLAMKGKDPQDELSFLGDHPCRIVQLHIPGVPAQRHLVVLPATAAGIYS